jgi:hypothetical protein
VTRNLTVEYRHRPSYSTRLCQYVVILDGDTEIMSCSHTHGTQNASQRCANKLITEINQQETK